MSPYRYKVIGPNETVLASIVERGFVYTLHRARVIDSNFVHATYRLRCR